jgi:hypothetical protein
MIHSQQFKPKDELRADLKQACIRVNQFYAQEGFKYLLPDIKETREVDQGPEFIVESKGIFASMDARTGRVRRLINDTPFRWGVPTEPDSSNAVAPTWTKARVLEIAQKFVDVFDKGPDRHFAEPEVTYAGEGQWHVVWKEISLSGAKFFDSAMGVKLTEEAGPYEVYINLSQQPYHPDSKEPMSRDAALIIAKSALEAEARTAPILSEGVTYWDTPTTSLGIYCGGGLSPYSRLAWIVSYKFKATDPYVRGESVGIVIDSQNGKVLCVLCGLLLVA